MHALIHMMCALIQLMHAFIQLISALIHLMCALNHLMWTLIQSMCTLNQLLRTLIQFNARINSIDVPIRLIKDNNNWIDVRNNSIIDWLIICCFTSRSRIFHLEGLQNLGLCSALRAFEQGGIFIMPHLLWHGASVFPVSSEGPPPFCRLLRHTRGCGESIQE
jgi:hypothetical protein